MLFILYVICKLILVFLSWKSLFLLEKFLGIVFLCMCVWNIKQSVINVNKVAAIFLVVMLLFVPNTWGLHKFLILENAYQNKAEEIIMQIQGNEDSYFERYELNFIDRFVYNNFCKSVMVLQHDGHYVVSFVKQKTFFNKYSFVYISDENALDLIYHPSKYMAISTDANALDSFEWIKGKSWAHVNWY